MRLCVGINDPFFSYVALSKESLNSDGQKTMNNDLTPKLIDH
jgi:hypothetical protein